MKYLILLPLLLCFQIGTSQIKVLFDATKAQTVANADWQIDADAFNLVYVNGLPVLSTSTGKEANPQRFPNPPAAQVMANTLETFWTGGLSSWAIENVKYGYQVETLPVGTKISYGDVSNPQDLKNYKVFVLCEPNILYTATESTAIKNFVANGGGLFMISNHRGSDRNFDGYDSPVILNDLMGPTNPFGIVFDTLNLWTVTTNKNFVANDAILDGPFGKVDTLKLSAGTTMTLSPIANPAVKGKFYLKNKPQGNTDAIVATSKYGLGKVFAICDSSMPDDGTGDVNDVLYDGWKTDASGNHRRLIMNATVWLATSDLQPLTVQKTIKNVSCNGQASGMINLVASGGNGQYAYLWSNGATTSNISNLTAGKYKVTITSSLANVIDSTTITESERLDVMFDIKPITCVVKGKITTSVKGGKAPYTYAWSSGETTSFIESTTVAPLTLNITDSLGCVLLTNVTMTASIEAPDLQIIGDSILNCYQNQITVSVNGVDPSIVYNWYTASHIVSGPTIQILTPGTYQMEATSLINGCMSIRRIIIRSDNKIPSLSISAVDTITCLRNFVQVEATTDADSITWLKNQEVISNLTKTDINLPGAYLLRVTNTKNGCANEQNFEVLADLSVPSVAIDTIINDVDNKNKGLARVKIISGEGPFTFSWKNSFSAILSTTAEITNQSAGLYTCEVTGRNGCTQKIDISIDNTSKVIDEDKVGTWILSPNPSQSILSIMGIKTSDGSLSISDVFGNILIKKPVESNTRIDVQHLNPGQYFLTICSQYGCKTKAFIVQRD